MLSQTEPEDSVPAEMRYRTAHSHLQDIIYRYILNHYAKKHHTEGTTS